MGYKNPYMAAWRRKNPDKHWNSMLKYRYGISINEYKTLSRLQNHRCKICGKKESRKHNRSGKVMKLSVDHCHRTGKIRGLLCQKCNLLIAHSRENRVILQSAINYLEVQ